MERRRTLEGLRQLTQLVRIQSTPKLRRFTAQKGFAPKVHFPPEKKTLRNLQDEQHPWLPLVFDLVWMSQATHHDDPTPDWFTVVLYKAQESGA